MYIYNATTRRSILFLCHPTTVDSEMLDKTLMTKQSFNQFCAWPPNEINLTLFMLQILVFISFRNEFRVKLNCIWCIQLYIIQYFASKWSRRNHRKCTNGLCHRVGLWTDISPCGHKYSSSIYISTIFRNSGPSYCPLGIHTLNTIMQRRKF